MNTSTETAEVEVFIDLECFGTPARTGLSHQIRMRDFLLRLLQEIENNSLRSHRVWGVARATRPFDTKLAIPLYQQTALSFIFLEQGAMLVWCKGIADAALIAEVKQRQEEGGLSQIILFVTNDEDFIETARFLSNAGHTILVAGYTPNKKWKEVAHSIWSLEELLGDQRYSKKARYRRNRRKRVALSAAPTAD